MASTSISVAGDRAYVKRFKRLAALLDRDMAELVRVALDKEYGDSLAELDAISFTSSVASMQHSSEDARGEAAFQSGWQDD